MQGDVDINIGDGTAVFDMAMHANTSSNHIPAPLIVSNRYNPLDDEELHAESKDEDLNLNVNSNPIIIDHSNTTATTPTTTTDVNITHTDSSSSSNNTSNDYSAQRNSSTVAKGVVNSDTNYNNGISIYFNSELPSTITDNKGYKAKQQSLKKLVDYHLKNVCKLSHDDVIDIDEVSYKTVNKSQHLFSIYFGTSAELNRIKSLLQQNHIQLHGASGKTIRGMIGPILLYRCTPSVADKLHDHCEFVKVKMDNQNEYAQYEWINFVCPESALASIVSAAKYAAVELHLAVDKNSHGLMVKIKRDQRKFCERCLSIDHFTQHCPSTTMCCRRCRGAHTSNKCDKPFTKRCVLCLQHSYFKKNANTHTYSTCISFHGTEYTIVESDGSAHALPAGTPATPQNKRTSRTVGSRSPTIASLPGNSSSNIRSSNSGGGNVPTYRSSVSSPSSTVVESQSSLVATSASASYASIANPHVSNESNQWMHFMAKQQETFLLTHSVMVGVCYIPPEGSSHYSFETDRSWFQSNINYVASRRITVLCGDFNARHAEFGDASSTNARGVWLNDLMMPIQMECLNYTWLDGEYTHVPTNPSHSRSMIDLVFTNAAGIIHSIEILRDTILVSDHLPVHIILKSPQASLSGNHDIVTPRQIYNVHTATEEQWKQYSDSLQIAFNNYKQLLGSWDQNPKYTNNR